jgi:hypothetical protein
MHWQALQEGLMMDRMVQPTATHVQAATQVQTAAHVTRQPSAARPDPVSRHASGHGNGLKSGLARKVMSGLLALSVSAIGLPGLASSAQADGYYGGDYGYETYDYDGYGGHAGGYGYGNDYYDRSYGQGYQYYEPPRRHYRKGKRHARRYAPQHGQHYRPPYVPHTEDDDAAAAVAGAVIGLAIGAIIASEANRHDHRANRYRSHATPPQPAPRQQSRASVGNQVARQSTIAPEPFTDAWYEYCADRYRSFDPATGTFQPYEGPRKLCR